MIVKRLLALAGAALVYVASPVALQAAEDYPTEPVRVIVSFGAGSGPDILGRAVAAQAEQQVDQPFVVENRPGANATVAIQALLQEPADGYTVLYTSTALAINPAMRANLAYDTFEDLTPVTDVGVGFGYFVLVNADSPIESVSDLTETAQQERLLYGSPGVGNALHLSMELLSTETGISMEHVPYNGSGEVLAALAGGDIHTMMISPAAALSYLRDGRLRAIGWTGAEPNEDFSEVPLVSETVEGFELAGWNGWFVRSGTPAEIVNRLAEVLSEASRQEDVAQLIRSGGYNHRGMTPDEFLAYLKADAARWQQAVEAAGIEPQ